MSDGTEVAAQVVAVDEDLDLAVLRLKPPPGVLRPAALGDSRHVRTGQFVVAIGYPYGFRQSVSLGIISAHGRGDSDAEGFLQTDAAVHPGSSGGALFNLKGEVIGVVAAMLVGGTESSGVNLVIPINVVKLFLTRSGAATGSSVAVE
jgi:S1-C subfamily serine protease